jgi:hypothetical protein
MKKIHRIWIMEHSSPTSKKMCHIPNPCTAFAVGITGASSKRVRRKKANLGSLGTIATILAWVRLVRDAKTAEI